MDSFLKMEEETKPDQPDEDDEAEEEKKDEMQGGQCRLEHPDYIVAEEFVEGTMMNVFWDETKGLAGSWELATRNNIGGEVTFFKECPKTFRTLFLEATIWNDLDLNSLNKNYCYSFVLQHPENRIVVPVQQPTLYLVDVFQIMNLEGGEIYVLPLDKSEVKEWTVWDTTNIRFPEVYEWSTYDELKSRFGSMNTSYQIMGVVVRNTQSGIRTKIRNPVYEMVRHMRGNQPELQYHYLSLRQDGKVSEYLKYYPEHKKPFMLFRKSLHDFTDTLFMRVVIKGKKNRCVSSRIISGHTCFNCINCIRKS